MKTIIAGCRSITDYSIVTQAIHAAPFTVTEVVSGMARGVDQLGARWAHEHNVPVTGCPADWQRHGKRAGLRRNRAMAEQAEALIAIWDGKSKGTRHMIKTARAMELRVFVYRF